MKRTMTHWFSLGFLGFAAATAGCAADSGDEASSESEVIASTSAYTSLEIQDCRWADDGFAPDAVGFCDGMGGFGIGLDRRDNRITLKVVSDDARYVPLDVSSLPFAGGPSRLGSKAEWRGRGIAIGQVDPYALIFRYFVTGADGVERNWLVVSRVEADNACILDTVSGAIPNHNEKARQIADANRTTKCPPRDCGIFNAGRVLAAGESFPSCNGAYKLTMQHDGNLVLYETETGAAKWHSRTHGTDGERAIMQDDGNFVVYGRSGRARWSSQSLERGSWLELEDDGRLSVIGPNEVGAVWVVNEPPYPAP